MPTFVHGKDGKVYANGYDLTSYLREAENEASIDLADVTTFGATTRAYLGGQMAATLSVKGLFEGTASTGIHARLAATLGTTDSLWAWLPAGDTLGYMAQCVTGVQTTYKKTGQVGDAVMVDADVTSNHGPDAGLILHTKSSETAVGNQIGVNNGAATTNGGVGYLMCFAGSGSSSPTMNVVIQDSADNVSFSTILSFTQLALGAQPSAERVAITGTVRQYVRARVDAVGGTSPTATIWVAFNRL